VIALSTVVAVGPIVLLNWSKWSRASVQALNRRRRHEIVVSGLGGGVELTAMPVPEADGRPDRPARSGAWIDPAKLTLDRATARDGTVVQLRPLRRNERDLVVGFFNGLSADSRYQRFLQPMPRLPEAYLRQLVDVDGCRHVAVVAIVDGECVGMARYIALPDEPGAAEVEVTVTDRYQGRGIGRLLVEALWPAAAQAGVATFVCYVHPTNRPMLKCLRSLGVEFAYRRDLGLVEGRLCLSDQPLTDEPWTRLTGPGLLVQHDRTTQGKSNGSSPGIPGEGSMVVAKA
jgi:ribosomal protein S18 acetylase RimI-like enzyme